MAEPYVHHAMMIAEYLQTFPHYCINDDAGDGTTLSILHNAASAIMTGSLAPAMSVFINTPVQPSSIQIVASLGVPTPASTMMGTVANSRIIFML